jgi:alcohol dehydrogenase
MERKMIFPFSSKVDVLFGEGASEQLGAKVKELGCTKVICIYDKGIQKAGLIDPLIDNMKAAGLDVIQFDGVLADPPDTMVNECAAIARNEKVDGVVGIGGGSSLDTAKSVNVLLSNPGNIEDYLGGPSTPHQPSKPLVLVPTTSGTGSEVTYIAVVTNTTRHSKDGLMGPASTASLAITDPALAKGMPPSITASTGMDTMAHAVEAYTSTQASIMSDFLAEKAIELTAKYLPMAVKNGDDMQARTQMSFASMLAGEAFNNAMIHIGHAFGAGLGAAHHVPHGIACAIGLSAVIDFVAELMHGKVRRVGELLGLELAPNLTPKEVGDKVSKRIRDFNKELGIPSLVDLGIKESDLENITKKTMADIGFMFLARKVEYDEALAIVKGLYDNT